MKTILAAVLAMFSLSAFATDYSKEAMDFKCEAGAGEMIYYNEIPAMGSEVKVCLIGDMVSGSIVKKGTENGMTHFSPMVLAHVQKTKDYEAVVVPDMPMALRFVHNYDGKGDYVYLFNMGTESETSRPVKLNPETAYSNIISLKMAKSIFPDSYGVTNNNPSKVEEAMPQNDGETYPQKFEDEPEEITKAERSVAIAGHCGDGKTTYYGKTVRGNKEVLICTYGLEKSIYSYGKIGADPDMVIERKLSELGRDDDQLIFSNKGINYIVGYQDGRQVLIVNQGSKDLAVIELDQRSVIDNIKTMLD